MFSTGIETEKSLPAVATAKPQATIERPGYAPSRLDELLVAEIFLVQATIESASALGDGIKAARELEGEDRRRKLGEVFRATRSNVVKPYKERLSYFRQLRDAS